MRTAWERPGRRSPLCVSGSVTHSVTMVTCVPTSACSGMVCASQLYLHNNALSVTILVISGGARGERDCSSPSSMQLESWGNLHSAPVCLTQTPSAKRAKISLLAEQAARWESCVGPASEPGASVSIQSLSQENKESGGLCAPPGQRQAPPSPPHTASSTSGGGRVRRRNCQESSMARWLGSKPALTRKWLKICILK